MVVGLGVSAVVALTRLFGESVALEYGPAELVVSVPFPSLVSGVMLCWWIDSISCSKGCVLVIARKMVALGASDLGGDVLEGVIVELRPPSNA